MRNSPFTAYVLMAASAVFAQQGPVKETDQTTPPKTICRYKRISPIRRVEKEPPIDFSFPTDFSPSSTWTVRFPKGTIVTVNGQDRTWSCVTGSIQKSDGWVTQEGWLKTVLLGPSMDAPK
ncbi:MAG: hypothetical protein WB679_04480 [Terracidiphilus sp.]